MFPLSGVRPATFKRLIKPTLDQVINSNNQKLREGLLDEVVSSKLFTTEYKESYSQLSQGKKLQPECQALLARIKGAETIAVARKLKKEFDHKLNELIGYKARLIGGITASDVDEKITLTPLAENIKTPHSGVTFFPKAAALEYPLWDEFVILLKKPVENAKPSSIEPASQHSTNGYQFKRSNGQSPSFFIQGDSETRSRAYRLGQQVQKQFETPEKDLGDVSSLSQFKRAHGQEPSFFSNRDPETRSRAYRLGLQIQNQFEKSPAFAPAEIVETKPVEKSLVAVPAITPVESDIARKQSKHAKFSEAKFEEGDFPRKKAPAITLGAKELAEEEKKANKMETILESPAESLIEPTPTVAPPTSFWDTLKTSSKENWQKRKEGVYQHAKKRHSSRMDRLNELIHFEKVLHDNDPDRIERSINIGLYHKTKKAEDWFLGKVHQATIGGSLSKSQPVLSVE